MAVVAFGKPLEPVALEAPRPAPGEVLLRVLACGVCRTDTKIVGGLMPFSAGQRLPHVPGHEVSGEVAVAGPDVALAVGQRLVVHNYWGCGRCPYCVAGLENLCDALRGWVGFTTPGGFQEYLTVPADHVVPLPAEIGPVEAATLSCATGTAYRAVVTRGQAKPGELVAIIGAGGVGLQALQMARACGAQTVAIDLGQAKLDAARRLGSEDAVLAPDARDRILDLTRGRGADIAVDTVGSGTTTALAASLVRKGGRVVQIGYTTVADHYPAIPTDQVVLREVSVVGSRYVTRPELERAVDLVARGLVKPVISGVMDLSQANQAIDQVRADAAVGRIVLSVAS